MIRLKLFFLVLMVFAQAAVNAQKLQPGFDPEEYLDVLSLNFGKYDSIKKAEAKPALYSLRYQSAVVGLDNRWSLWMRKDEGVGVISIRGTVSSGASWLANVYAVMQPAAGAFSLNDTTLFRYRLASDSGAAVHTGWLVALASMAGSIEQQILLAYSRGTKEFLIVGHSQGAGIAFLLRSYLYYRALSGDLPKDILFKTYCSAAPRPGNLYYGYDFEFINRGGWAFTILNAADWVPETPLTVQQFSDMNNLNPFADVGSMLRGQKLAIRLYAKLVYRKLGRPAEKSVRRQQKFLGKKVGKEVRKKLPGLKGLQEVPTQHYMRAGSPVILMPDAAYYEHFRNDPNQARAVWTHHGFAAYVWLLRKDYLK